MVEVWEANSRVRTNDDGPGRTGVSKGPDWATALILTSQPAFSLDDTALDGEKVRHLSPRIIGRHNHMFPAARQEYLFIEGDNDETILFVGSLMSPAPTIIPMRRTSLTSADRNHSGIYKAVYVYVRVLISRFKVVQPDAP